MKKLLIAGLAASAITMSSAKEGLDITGKTKYYTVHPLFHPFPEETKVLQSIDRFGPVGIGIDLAPPGCW